MIDGTPTVDIETTEWPENGGAYGWFNAITLRNQENAGEHSLPSYYRLLT